MDAVLIHSSGCGINPSHYYESMVVDASLVTLQMGWSLPYTAVEVDNEGTKVVVVLAACLQVKSTH